MSQDKRKTKAQLAAELDQAQMRNAQTLAALQRINRVLRAIRNVNQIIVRERDAKRMLQGACDSLVETQGYYGAWVALVDKAGQATGAVASGECAADRLDQLSQRGLPACGRNALQRLGVAAINPPAPVCADCRLLSLLADIYSDRQVMVTRLEYAGQVFGVLGVSAPGQVELDQEEQDLLEEVASDLAFALHSIEVEQEREHAKQEVAALAKFPAENPNPVLRIRRDGVVLYANRASAPLLEMWQCQVGQTLPRLWRELVEVIISSEQGATIEAVLDGRVFLLVFALVVEQGYVNVYGLDITERDRVENALRASEQELQLTLDATTDGIWKWDFRTDKLFFSSRYYAMLGYEVGEFPATYQGWVGLIHPDDVESVLRVATEYLTSKPDIYENEFRLRTKAGDYRWIHTRARVVERDEKGEAVRMIGHHEDITERKQAEEQIKAALYENQALLQEVHHRVRNNMQLILSLIDLQANRISDAQARGYFKAAEGRIRAMALVQEYLHRSPDLAQVHFATYVQRLAFMLFPALRVNPDLFQLEIEVGNEAALSMNQATPCGLLINELLTNSLRHAFPNTERNEDRKVGIQMHSEGEQATLTIYDNGVGLPPDFDWRNPPTLGLKLVHTLAEQLGATLELDCSHGTRFTVTFER